MRIARVQAWWVRIPIETARQHRSDFGQITTFDAAIVRVETESGVVGWGEGKNAAGSAGTYGTLIGLINAEFGPALIGRDARDISVIWEMLYNGVRHRSAAASGHAMPQLARRGLTVAAISAIDIALWDILGKSVGQPVWRLLGGRKAERMPAYASGGWAPAETIGDQLGSYIEQGGFRAVKMRVGSMDGAPQVSAARVHAARKALGPAVSIMVDAHGTYTVGDAKRFAHLVRDADLAWFEEPVTADDKQGLAEVRAACGIPIACGESEATRFDFRDLAVLRAADIFQPDLGFCGGIS
ncbi:MAG: mandelate racemase/muconate lactonizing enzyme family protein, partial [Mesorhizobium sp.]|nr:mandelate racemase/muconate lactonizing enzyme family protein [Mesorhizobium sp.]